MTTENHQPGRDRLRWTLEITALVLTIVVCLAVLYRIGVPSRERGQLPRTQRATAPAVIPRDPVTMNQRRVGSPAAKAAMIVFSDFECPFCGTFATQTWPEVQRLYVQTGKLQVSFHNLPLTRIHPFALAAAVAAECAGEQQKFWPMHDALFADQRHLTGDDLNRLAVGMSLDVRRFQACLPGDARRQVEMEASEAGALGVTGTPTFFLGKLEDDGRLRVAQRFGGAAGIARFRDAIEIVLNALSRH